MCAVSGRKGFLVQIGIDDRESAFRAAGMENYVDKVIKIQITGDTVNEINQAAEAEGLTSAQWIRATIAAELTRLQERRPIDDYIDYLRGSR